MIIPRDKPILRNLNSYYLDIPRLLDHYQWSNMTGCIQFNAKEAEGAVFFGQDQIHNALFRDSQGETTGIKAIVKAYIPIISTTK